MKYHVAAPKCIAAVGIALAETVAGLMAAKGQADQAQQQCQQLAQDAAAVADPAQSIADNATPKLGETPSDPIQGPPNFNTVGVASKDCVGAACPTASSSNPFGTGDTSSGNPTAKMGDPTGNFNGGASGSSHSDGPGTNPVAVASKSGSSGDDISYADAKSEIPPSIGGGAGDSNPTHAGMLGPVKVKNGMDMVDTGSNKTLTIWQRATYRYYGPVGSRYNTLAKIERIRKEAGLLSVPVQAKALNANPSGTTSVSLQRK